MFSQYIIVCFIFSLSNGRKPDCNYAFDSLDANITLSTSTELYDVAHRISLTELTTGKPAENKYFYMREQSNYFTLEGPVLMVTACLPPGLRVNLTFFIEAEASCSPGYLIINVEPTVPVFNHHPDTVTVDVDTCSPPELIEVYELEFENKEDCNNFNCSIFCEICPGKTFWTNETKILTDSKNIRFNGLHVLQVKCFDSNLSIPYPGLVAETEIGVVFERLDTCQMSATKIPTTSLTIKTTSSATTKRTSQTTSRTVVHQFSTTLSSGKTMTTTGIRTTQTIAKTSASSVSTTAKIPSKIKSTLFKATGKSATVQPATSLSTKISSMSSNSAHPSTAFASVSATTVMSLSTTTGSPISTHINAVGFFDETSNIAVVSAVGGVVVLFALMSIIYTVWSRCCRFGPASSRFDSEKSRGHSV